MRKTSPLAALFPAIREEILSTLLAEPARSWYLSHLASHLGRTPSSLQRELESLVAAGILNRRQEANHVYFQANRDCPLYPELASLFQKTTGLADALRGVLAPLADRIQVAFVYGSVARGQPHAASDIDLLVIGDLGLANLVSVLQKAEHQLARPVNASVYSPREFREKVARRHHFLVSVLGGEKVFLIGSEHELEQLAQRETTSAAYHEQAGAG